MTHAQTYIRLFGLIDRREITYDLLWALFKPNEEICTLCQGSGTPMYFRYSYGEAKTRVNNLEYFRVEGRCFNHDGAMLGESVAFVDIERFRGPKRLGHLPPYPLRLYQDAKALRSDLRDRGRMFVALVEGYYYEQDQGQAFQKEDKGYVIKTSVDGRIVVSLRPPSTAIHNYFCE